MTRSIYSSAAVASVLWATSAYGFTPVGEPQAVPESTVSSYWQQQVANRGDSIWSGCLPTLREGVSWPACLNEVVEDANPAQFPDRIQKPQDLWLAEGQAYWFPLREGVRAQTTASSETNQLLADVGTLVENFASAALVEAGLDESPIITAIQAELAGKLDRREVVQTVQTVLASEGVGSQLLDDIRTDLNEQFDALEYRLVTDLEALQQEVAELRAEVAELRGEVSTLSAELVGKVDVEAFNELLARVESGEVVDQSRFNALFREFAAEQDLSSFFDLEELRRVAQAGFEDRLDALNDRVGTVEGEIQSFDGRLGTVESILGEDGVVQDRFADLEGRVEAVETGGQTMLTADSRWYMHPFFWSLLSVALAVVLSWLLGRWLWQSKLQSLEDSNAALENSLDESDKSLLEVQKTQAFMLEMDARGHFRCPELTQQRLDEMENSNQLILQPVTGRTIKVRLTKRFTSDGVAYLEVEGIQGTDAIHAKKVDGQYQLTVLQIYQVVGKALGENRILGLTALKKAS